MKGLFKSNFLAVWTNAKIFLLFMFAMGIAVIIIPDQTWQMAMNSGFSDHEILKIWIYRGNYTQKNRMFSFILCYTKNGQICLDKHI